MDTLQVVANHLESKPSPTLSQSGSYLISSFHTNITNEVTNTTTHSFKIDTDLDIDTRDVRTQSHLVGYQRSTFVAQYEQDRIPLEGC